MSINVSPSHHHDSSTSASSATAENDLEDRVLCLSRQTSTVSLRGGLQDGEDEEELKRYLPQIERVNVKYLLLSQLIIIMSTVISP